MKSPRLVIRRHRPLRDVVEAIAVFMLIGIAVYLLFIEDHGPLEGRIAELTQERDHAHSLSVQRKAKITRLNERIAILERGTEIERRANEEIGRYVTQLEVEVLGMREEIAFYRDIVSPDDAHELAIEAFEIRDAGGGRSFHYRLVLTRNMKSDKVMAGVVDLLVTGRQEGKPRQLSYFDVSGSQARDIEFSFRYFQQLEGRLILPEGFEPHSVEVHISTVDGRATNVQQTFEWLTLTG